MQKVLPLILLCFIFSLPGKAQFTRYIIKFKDKGSNPFSLDNPLQYLSQRSLDRRTRYNIAIDSTDLPVTPRYIDSLRLSGNVSILNVSKWLNQVAIQTTDDVALMKINNFPFVENTSPIAAKGGALNPVNKRLDTDMSELGIMKAPIHPGSRLAFDNIAGLKIESGNSSALQTNKPGHVLRTTTDIYDYGESGAQVKIHQGNFLHNHGFRGDDMQMVVLDAGFYHYLSLPTFDSVRNNNQILGTWDFVDNEQSVDEDYYHGMQCLSTIAANIPGTFIGTAPNTSFYLFRTEDVASEYPVEEQNWAAGMEKADSLGVDISSTSLGYSRFDNAQFDHTYSDMDGNTTLSAKASDMAAKKGMLVVTAAGNEGNSTWHYLITPSDADSNLCVGAVDVSGNVAGFSSYGPASDGQIKPSVAAVGLNAVVANINSGQPSFNSGTSFACPNMAGITSCLWQAFPEINNMGIVAALESSASNVTTPDDRTGYGIPDAKKAFVILQKSLFSKQFSNSDCNSTIQLNIKTDNTMTVEIERKLASESGYATIATLQNNENFGAHNLSYTDDLSNTGTGTIAYRYKMNIAADTTFFLDSLSMNHLQNCNGTAPVNDLVIVQQQENASDVILTIKRISPAKVNIIIQNAAGQKVYKQELQQAAGTQTYTLNLKKIIASKGFYFLSVFIDNKKIRTKEIIRP